MICSCCGANSASNEFCTVCGKRFSDAASAAKTTVKETPVYSGGGILTRKKPIISSSFTTGTTFAIIGCVCYLILIFMSWSEYEENFIRGFAYSRIGTRDETIAWIYMALMLSATILLPVGLVIFSAGADNGKTTGVNIIITTLVIWLICVGANMIYYYTEYLPKIGDAFDSFERGMDRLSNSSSAEVRDYFRVIGNLYSYLFESIIYPGFMIIWISVAIHGVNCIGKNIKLKTNSSSPSAVASGMGKIIGVMMLVLVALAVMADKDFFEEVFEDTEDTMSFIRYLSFSIMIIAFGAFFNRIRKGENYYSDTSAPISVSYTTETYSTVPEEIPEVYTPPVTEPEPTAKVATKFCIYCGRPLSESEVCSCIEARMNADREIPVADHVVTETVGYDGPSRVNINIKHRPAPNSAEAREMEEGAKMFSAPGDL